MYESTCHLQSVNLDHQHFFSGVLRYSVQCLQLLAENILLITIPSKISNLQTIEPSHCSYCCRQIPIGFCRFGGLQYKLLDAAVGVKDLFLSFVEEAARKELLLVSLCLFVAISFWQYRLKNSATPQRWMVPPSITLQHRSLNGSCSSLFAAVNRNLWISFSTLMASAHKMECFVTGVKLRNKTRGIDGGTKWVEPSCLNPKFVFS